MNDSFRIAFWCLVVSLGLPLLMFTGAQFLPIDQSKLLALHERNPHWGLHRRAPGSAVPKQNAPIPAPQPRRQQAEPVMISGLDEEPSVPEVDPFASSTPEPEQIVRKRPTATLTAGQPNAARNQKLTLQAPQAAEEAPPAVERKEAPAPKKTPEPSTFDSKTGPNRHVEFKVEPVAPPGLDRVDRSIVEARLAALQQHLDRLSQLQIEQSQQQRQSDQSQQAALRAQQLEDQKNLRDLERQVHALQVALEASRQQAIAKAEKANEAKAESADSRKDLDKPFLKGDLSKDGQINLECREVAGGEALALLGKLSGKNLVVSQQLTQKVSAHLQSVSFDQGLASLTKALGAVSERDGEFIYVKSSKEVEPPVIVTRRPIAKLYRTQHISAQEMEPLLEPLLSPEIGKLSVTRGGTGDIREGTIDGLAQRDALLVFDTPEVQQEIEKVLAAMDQPPVQLEIEATILSVQLNEGLRQGVNLSELNGFAPSSPATANCGPGGCVTPISMLGEPGLKCGRLVCGCRQFIQNLGQIAETQLVANPRVMVLNRQPACLAIGGRFGYRTADRKCADVQFIDAGTRLHIRPTVSADGLIRLEVHPEFSSAMLDLQTGLPKIKTAEVATQVLVPNGQTVVVGGLMEERLLPPAPRRKGDGHWPWASDRRVTAETARNEIIVLITPRISHESGAILSTSPELATPQPIPALPPASESVVPAPRESATRKGSSSKAKSMPTESVVAGPRSKRKVDVAPKAEVPLYESGSIPESEMPLLQVSLGKEAEPPVGREPQSSRPPKLELRLPALPGVASVRTNSDAEPALGLEPSESNADDDLRVRRALAVPSTEDVPGLKPGTLLMLPAPPGTDDAAAASPKSGHATVAGRPARAKTAKAENTRSEPARLKPESGSNLPNAKPITPEAAGKQEHRDSPYSAEPLKMSTEEQALLSPDFVPTSE